MRQAFPALLCFTTLLLATAGCSDNQTPDILAVATKTAVAPAKDATPTSLRMAHMRQVQLDAPAHYAFAPSADKTNVRADNLEHKLRAELDDQAHLRIVQRDDGSWSALFQLTSVGRASDMHAVAKVTTGPEVDHTQAKYRRGDGIEETYLNGPLGVEQGFVIARAPERITAEPLSLEVQVEGSLHAEDSGRGTVALRDDSGNVVLRYSDLLAHDAQGRDLRTAMRVEHGSIYLDIEDQAAEYPVTIDPLVWVPDDKMLAKNPGTVFDQLGNTIAISGDTAIVGAQGNDEKAVDAGAAYVFVRTMSGWVQQQKLLASDAQAADHFGCSVSLDGDTIIVGAYGQDAGGKSDAGAAYIFVRANGVWTEQKKVAGNNADDYFGYSVALWGTTALVGAYGDDTKGTMAGAAYVLNKDQGGANNWGASNKLIPDDGASQDNFGLNVALDLNTAVIGARGDDDKGSLSGSAYVYARSGGVWSLQQKLTASDGAALDYFGSSVSIDGDSIAVGAFLANLTNADAGAAYVFTRSGTTWTEQQKLVSPDPDTQDYFGVSVAISGDRLFVGAWADDPVVGMSTLNDGGSAYSYTRTAGMWSLQKKINASDATGGDGFGTAVALDGTTAIIGAPSDDDVGTNAGSAYLLDKDQGGVDNWGEVTKVRALDGLVNEFLGYSVAVSGNTVIAGAYGANDFGTESGVAYVFLRSGPGWTEQAKLVPADGTPSDRAGFTVAISGDTAIVGAYLKDGMLGIDEGAAYVFVRTGMTWTQQAKLVAPDAAVSDQFGVAVALDGDTAVIGAFGDDDKGSASGSAYVFLRTGTTWALEAKLNAADGVANDNFGRSVAIAGNTVIVGSPNDDDTATNSGSAYVFTRMGTTWTQEAKLVAADPNASAALGFSVAIHGDTAIAGAYLDDNVAAMVTDVGAAYVYTRMGTTWTQEAKLVAADAEMNDRLGNSVAVNGNTAVIGAHFDDDKATNTGSVYVFERAGTTWSQQTKLTTQDATASDFFGFSVAFDGTTLVGGAYGDDDRGSASGTAYSFTLKKTNGLSCANASECDSGHCVDGVCCIINACPDCYSCGLPGSLGQCAADSGAMGSACGDNVARPCSDPDTCDANGVCQPNHLAALAACGDSMAKPCSAPDSCDGLGTCLTNDSPAGMACNDASATECTQPDTCNSAGECVSNDETDGKTCTGGVCMAGMCAGGSSSSSSSSSGAGGAGGSGGSGGEGGMVETGGAGGGGSTTPPPADGCGCKVAGGTSASGNGWSLLVMFGMAAASWHRRAQRRKALAAPAALVTSSVLALGAVMGGCGSETTNTTTKGAGGAGNSANAGGMGGEAGGGGSSSTGGQGGGMECPPAKVCAFECCQADQDCIQGACVSQCPASQQRCGENMNICCAVGEECVSSVCAAPCPAPQVRCGALQACCATGEVCANDACVVPGNTCIDFADCNDNEYCEPTLGVCLSAATLPDCKYRPPVGTFAPKKEWTYSPITAPYVRGYAAQPATTICGAAGSVPLAFPNSDDSLVVVSLGTLEIPFFDKTRNVMTVSTNGWLTFDPSYKGNTASVNVAWPLTTNANTMVAPYWDDLKNVTGCLLVDNTNKRVVVEWRGEIVANGEWIRVQAAMNAVGHKDAGVVELSYLELGPTQDGDGATIGIAESVTNRFVQHGFNRNGAVSTSTKLRYSYVPMHNRFDALAAPAVFDVDGDGKPEVIFPAYDDNPSANSTMPNDPIYDLHSGVLTILNGEDGTMQARPVETPGYDGYLGAGAVLSIADLDGDGVVEIIGTGRLEPMVPSAPYVKAFNRDGTLRWISNVPINFNHDGWGGGVHVADLNRDGKPEIFFGLNVYNHEGVLQWAKPVEYGQPATTAADVDGDGNLELISDRSVYRYDGTLIWTRQDLGAYHFPSIADFDLDGTPEIALVGGGQVIILNGNDGKTFWGPIKLYTDGGGPLNIGDFDGDGYPEMGTAGEGLYAVLDLQCTGTPLPAGCDREGVRWGIPTKDISSNVTGSSLFDFEGDGIAEVIYSDECFTRVFAGQDGLVLFESPVNTRTATEYPLVADVDGDNNAEIIVVANEVVPNCSSAPWNQGMLGTPWNEAPYPPPFCGPNVVCGYRGLTVYGDALDNWVRTRRIWSGHAYHITNILSNGGIPMQEDPNWKQPGYNNFRMNAQGAGVFSAPDLQVELTADTSTCPTKLRLRAKVLNKGAIGVSAGVEVTFYHGMEVIGVVTTPADVLPGGSIEVVLDYNVLVGELDKPQDFKAVVDSNMANNECEGGGEDNNVATTTGLCSATNPK